MVANEIHAPALTDIQPFNELRAEFLNTSTDFSLFEAEDNVFFGIVSFTFFTKGTAGQKLYFTRVRFEEKRSLNHSSLLVSTKLGSDRCMKMAGIRMHSRLTMLTIMAIA